MSSSENKNSTELHVEADEKHLLLDHNYDGIQELNHPLPGWWNFFFYVGIFFGVGYWVYYTFMGGPTLRDELKADMAVVREAQEMEKKLNSSFSQKKFDEYNVPGNKERALQVYTDNCMQCHMEGGRGDVGPNLTDNHWLRTKGTPETNFQIVYNGSEENGMPAWGEVLSSEEIYLALTYVNSLRNTFHKEGKAPQGEKIVE